MKNDLTTAIIASILGVAVAYFVTNMFFDKIEDVSISAVDPNLTVELAEPDESIFNYKAVNPTVEVYVGECDEYDSTTGECLDKNNGSLEKTEQDSDESDNTEKVESTEESTDDNVKTANEEETEEDF